MGGDMGLDGDMPLEVEEPEDWSDEERDEQGDPGPSGRQAIYNVEAMHDKLEDIAWVEQQAWIQSLSITGEENYEVEDVEDDIARELAFYNQALAAAVEAVGRFEEAQVPWRRAADFYAEMVKSDEHMARVKGQLMYEQKQIEEAEERRKGREAKRFQKQLNAEKAKERAQAKKAAIAQVQQLRKQRERSGFAGGVDVEAELERMDGRAAASPAASGVRIRSDTGPGKSKKRQFKDAKFGFGGRKRLQKQNDAKSAADMGSYKPARFSDGIAKKVASKRTAKGKPGKQHQRPGKSKRSAMRGKRA